MKIIQFCIPAPGEVMVLTDEGHLYERRRDSRHFPAPGQAQRYQWFRVQGPEDPIEADMQRAAELRAQAAALEAAANKGQP